MLTKDDFTKLYNTLYGKKITILGHDNIDVDSTLSAILFSKLLTFLKIENEFLILEKVKEDDTYTIIKKLFDIDIKVYEKLEEESSRNLVLLDHYETVHKGNILACIDHHTTLKDINYPFKYVKSSCATAYLIYEIMILAGYVPTKQDISMMIMAMLIDTVSFRSSKAVERETIVAKNLAKEYGIDFDLLEKYGLGLTDISSMTDEQIISNGYKWYNFTRPKDVGSSYLQLYGMPSKDTLNHWLELIIQKRKRTDADILVFLLFDVKESKTYEYIFTKEGNIEMYLHDGILSRGKDIMPKIEKRVLNS